MGASPSLIIMWIAYTFTGIFPIVYVALKGVTRNEHEYHLS